MRVFQRGVDESLVIGSDVVVTVLDVHAGYVRLGITDPNSEPVYREELLFLENEFDADEEGSSLQLAGLIP
jgi:carbon storage regulator CsrA